MSNELANNHGKDSGSKDFMEVEAIMSLFNAPEFVSISDALCSNQIVM